MRVGVVSDTHGNTKTLLALKEKAGKVDAWIHLGDFADDAKVLNDVPCYVVRGNCDFSTKYELEQVITLGGVRIFITHGHKYSPAYDRTNLMYRAEELNCKAALYGHTHVSLIELNYGLWVVNPGSPTSPRNGREPSFAILEIENSQVYASIITL